MLSRIFTKPEPEEVRAQATVWGNWPGDVATSGEVTQASALQLLAVAGCVRLITDSIATLPVDVYREDNTGIRTEVSKPYWLKEPTVDLDFTAWCTQLLTSLLLHGNAYVIVTREGARIVELIPVDPTAVTVRRVQGRKSFIVHGVPFPGEMRHIKGLMLPGSDTGLSPLEYARQSISGGLSAQQFANDNFDQGLNMPGVIEAPGVVSPDVIQATVQAWKRARSKRNRGMPGMLQAGMVWKPTGVTNEQAQFLQTRQWTAAEVAAQVFLVDPRELGIPLTGSTLEYTNAESRKADLAQKALMPWMARIEAMITALLPNPQFMKFNLDAFLRADSSARWSIYETASRINTAATALGMPPVLTTTEMRDFEDLGTVEEYPAPEVAPAPQMNSAPLVIENHMHLPEQRTEAPVTNVDVHVPEQRTPDVTVNVEPPGVVVDVQPTTVHVPAAEVRVVQEAPTPTVTRRTVERDDNGRIATVIDEVV